MSDILRGMIRQLILFAVVCLSSGCAQILGIEDLPELVDANTPDARTPDARTPDAVPPDARTSYDHSPGYPMFEYEGNYPNETPCDGLYGVPDTDWRRVATFEGYEITLEYFYHWDCGSFAKISNAPENCAAILERSTDEGNTWAWVSEIVEPGLNFAYTMTGNNLAGRLSRAALSCDGDVIARTEWYPAPAASP